MGRRLDWSSPLFCLSGGDSAGATTHHLFGELQRRLSLCSRSSSQSRFRLLVPLPCAERSRAEQSSSPVPSGHPPPHRHCFSRPELPKSRFVPSSTSTAPSRARPSPIPAESAPSPLARRRRPPSPAALLHDPASPTVPNPDSTHPEVALYLLELFPHFPLTAGDRARRNPAGQRRRAPSPILSPIFAPKSGSSGFGTRKFRVSS